MRFANPLGLLALGLAVPVLLLHMLKPRRQTREVTSTFLWQEMATPVSAAAPWQRLRPTLLLLLQLLVVGLLALSIARPVRVLPSPLAPHTVFLIDTSGSMAATDGHPDRLAAAKDAVFGLYRDLPAGGKASVVEVNAHPRVVLTASPDEGSFTDAVEALRTSPGGGDFASAFTLAASLETADSPIGFVLVSDGGLTDDEKRVIPAGTRYVPVGEQDTNRAITRLSLEPRGSGQHARVSVRNTGGGESSQLLRLDVDGKTASTTELSLGRGEGKEYDVDLPAGDHVEAHLEGEDLLSSDNHAYAVANKRRDVKVVMFGPDDPYISKLLGVVPGVSLERRDQPGSAAGFDLAIYDGVDPPADPGAPYLAIAPPHGTGAVSVTGSVNRPAVTLVRSDHPLLRDVDVTRVAILKAQKVEAPTADVLLGAEGAPLLLRGSHNGRSFAYLSFALADSNLPLDIAFPILVDRLVTEFAGADAGASDVVVGDPLPIDTTGGATIVDPIGRQTSVAPGAAVPVADRIGFWTLQTPNRPERLIAVNADPKESTLKVEPSLPIAERPPAAGVEATGERSLLPWLVVPLLALVVLEFLVARRRVGVSRRQWRVASVLRVATVAVLVLALLGLTYSHAGDQVATVFLVDASDSLGGARRAEAVSWVRDALAKQPDGGLSAVALFGGDARLELTMNERNQLSQPAVKIDADRTSLANAMRLAAAVLPADAKRRIVLLSDGRATEGDVFAEAGRLADSGVQVDVHTVGRSASTDIALRSLDGPSSVHVGDKVDLQAKVNASPAGTATLTLERDGTMVEEKTVELQPGENTVTFSTTATEPGLQRYRVRITGTGDSVAENNLAFTAVQVEGPARVLLLEGQPGNSKELADALRAGGLSVDTRAAADVPALDQLTQYTTTVLVDVDVAQLSAEAIKTLGGATRDLGHGLVTVGGTHSYGLGGYRDSELEQLLPVRSEITDPKRQKKVAEVLAIDTSGSMGACHCAGNNNGMAGGGNRAGGGVNKTDISRAAAARSIDALNKDDEIGLLAANNSDQWVIDLQQLPSEDVITNGLHALQPSGGTNLHSTLKNAADKLRQSKAGLKHIILFTDGFTSPQVLDELAKDAGNLNNEGITVSVLATGEGAATQLEQVARSGGGRFYPGHDLQSIPQIMEQETILASRDFINEGEFFPEIASAAKPVRDLTSSPPLLGYVATTPKPSASTDLKIGEEKDPLLASWQLGLGRVTSWTSDASDKWSQRWKSWDKYVTFWSDVVKDTFPTANGNGALHARIVNGQLEVQLEGEQPWPDGAVAVARVTSPDLQGHDVPLERKNATTFAGQVSAPAPGSYAAGAQVKTGDQVAFSGNALTSLSYSAEYVPGEPDKALMAKLSSLTHGRGEIVAAQAFDPADLQAGVSRVALAAWLLALAGLLWLAVIATSKLATRGLVRARVRAVRQRSAARLHRDRKLGPSSLAAPPARPHKPSPRPKEPERSIGDDVPAATPPTLGHLLEKRRSRGSGSATIPVEDGDSGSSREH